MLDLTTKSVSWMIVTFILFIALTPGVLLTVGSSGPNIVVAGDLVISTPIVVHAIVFALVLSVVGKRVVKVIEQALGVKAKFIKDASSAIRSSLK
jgi:F0F1-type ATP synthase membrane subunit b/b'